MVGETFDSWKICVDKAIDLYPDSVTIYSASGTVWDGRAEAIAPPGGITLGATDWRVSGFWLLTGRLKGDFSTQLDDTSRLNGGFSKPLLGQSLSLSDAQGILDLALIPANLRPNGVTGRVGLSFDHIDLDAMWPRSAQGSIPGKRRRIVSRPDSSTRRAMWLPMQKCSP